MFDWLKKKDNELVITNDMKQADSYLGVILNTVKNLSRRMSGGSLFGVSPNGKRNYNELFGYGEQLDYQDYKGMYERGGYAATIVNLFPKLCWRDMPTIKLNDNDILEGELKLLKRSGFFNALERADIANRIGSYSVLFLGIPDGLNPDLPIGSAKKGNFKGLYFNVYEEDGIEVVSYDMDPASPRFNLPEMYQLQVTINKDGTLQKNVSSILAHHSRIIHMAEGALSSSLEGMSALKQPWNSLMDKEKVRGSSAEAYYRNARQKLALETKDGFTPSKDEQVKAALKQNVEDFQNNQDDTLRLNGMTANMLQPSMASPRDSFDISTEDAAGTSRIPVRFLTTKAGGSVTGSEDKAALNGVIMDRQDQECTLWLFDGLEAMAEAGLLDLPDETEIVWPVQSSLSEKESSESAKNKGEAFKAVADGLSTIGGDDVIAKSVFKEIGLDNIDIDEINLTDDKDLDKSIKE